MLRTLNITIFNALNGLAGKNAILDKIATVLAEFLPLVFILSLIYLWIRHAESRKSVLYAVYSTVLGILMNIVISWLYYHPRPFVDRIGILVSPHAADSSFPSDHTTFMLSMSLVLLYCAKTRRIGVALTALGLFGGILRVYTGFHYPFDILGSVIVATLASVVVYKSKDSLSKMNANLIKLYEAHRK